MCPPIFRRAPAPWRRRRRCRLICRARRCRRRQRRRRCARRPAPGPPMTAPSIVAAGDAAAQAFVEIGDLAGAEAGSDRRQHDPVGIGAEARHPPRRRRREQLAVMVEDVAIALAGRDQHQFGVLTGLRQREGQAFDRGAVIVAADQQAFCPRAQLSRYRHVVKGPPRHLAGGDKMVPASGGEAELQQAILVGPGALAGIGDQHHCLAGAL